MELINATKMQAAYTLGLDPTGREHLVIAVKGTFKFSNGIQAASLAEEQVPLVMADEYTGEPGLSSVLYESDFAPYKPKCDVLLNGHAYAPDGRPAENFRVGLTVGNMSKIFEVFGARFWYRKLTGMHPSKPKYAVKIPISYEHAFGGVDIHPEDPEKIRAYMDNPVGTGYFPYTPSKQLEGRLVPNTSQVGQPIKSVTGKYEPQSFGIVGRNFSLRTKMAGTYDQSWLDNVFPFLPPDFNSKYFQSAPTDQQIEYPKGGEQVVLINLTPEGRTTFRLPRMHVPVEFSNVDFDRNQVDAVVDTIMIEPDNDRIMLTWRASLPLKRNIFEVAQVVVGKMSKAWYRARATGKTYYATFAEHVRSKKQRNLESVKTQKEASEEEQILQDED